MPKRFSTSELANRLRHRSDELRLTKAEIARRSGVHPAQVGRILQGKHRRISESVLRICNVLGVDLGIVGDQAAQDRTWIADSALAIWDGTHEDAVGIVELLRSIARVKGSPR